MNDDDIEQDDIIKENDLKENTLLNKYSNNFKEMPFYLMTLEDNYGECKQIKIYQNSDPFELSYNFCKENNLDFESMKYIKKNIKEIIKRFSDTDKKESNFINSDSIYELVDEENSNDESEELENELLIQGFKAKLIDRPGAFHVKVDSPSYGPVQINYSIKDKSYTISNYEEVFRTYKEQNMTNFDSIVEFLA